ncbi:hypothetical protein Z517_04394 [Fonsecaea pedrosoi CBS 271.37]|uniref:DNA (cytosine-5-)-methyltransferase n=1 Tax=Fonsecaea pedrosoi CBS 271.37 TaxID=1442368 RepID=A0A0D2H9X5_9EURO|nr:uncharacterized protein Z517_04394 [Fonsecaea pedrosoi CBS 271.37]KIW81369.1 hypothetical protein Z517_04394 [Fonsecaea pedrosoi CBS 271.37]
MKFEDDGEEFHTSHSQFEDNEDGGGFYTSEPQFNDRDDRDVLKPGVHHLGLTKTFTPGWGPRDAFREFYQNWKDGIIESFGVDPHSIKPIFVRNDDEEIHITVSDNTTASMASRRGRPLGYIRFQAKQGSLELTNFRAKLDRKHLDLGETSKRGKKALAGGHGEGFKLAALVMRRNGHSVRFETNSFCWNFSFRGTRPSLCCVLSEPGPKLVREQREEYKRRVMAGDTQRGLTPYIWEDMTVKIGKSRDRGGSQKVSEEDFRKWMEVSIDLDTPESGGIVRTTTGDLILDPRFRGRIYLHGLLVSQTSDDAQNDEGLCFGYNFYEGIINRDRQRMASPREEAKALASIWTQAIQLKGDSVIDAFVKLFAEDEAAADVEHSYKFISRLTAQSICRRLKESQPDAFFYSERDASRQNATTDEDIILTELKKQPLKLGKKLWTILRQEPPLMRTPLEERDHLFGTSQPIKPDMDIFSLSIIHALNGSFAQDPRMGNIRIEFVDGANTDIDLLYSSDQALLQIHAKWLDVVRVHQESSCEFFQVAGQQMTDESAFFCDHVVQDLLEAAFDEIREQLELTPVTAARLRRQAVEYLRKMPRAIKMSSANGGRKLKVEWTGNESGAFMLRYGSNIHYWVTLHKERSCRQRKTEVLNVAGVRFSEPRQASGQPEQAEGLCDCPTRTVSQAHSEVIFDGLDPSEVYFPMVSRAEAPSFFGLPPTSIDEVSDADMNIDTDLDLKPEPCLKSDTSEDDSASGQESRVPPRDHQQVHPWAPNLVGRPKVNSLETTRLHKDEQDWLAWHQQYLQSGFSSAPRESSQLDVTFLFALLSEGLNITFEKDHYYRIQLEGEEGEQVIFVHNISQGINVPSERRYFFLVTKYSALSSILPYEQPREIGNPALVDQEVVLHFSNFDKMRTSQDAETIYLDDIRSAQRRVCVSNLADMLLDMDPQRLFCRFAVSKASTDGGVTTTTPLASHLLLHDGYHRERPSLRSDVVPVAFDLSPSVLGVSEGFAGRGFKIQAAFGLDESKHHTWRNRHLVATCFDGTICNVLKDFDSGRLLPPPQPNPAPPKVLLFAPEHQCFRLDMQNHQMPTVLQFLKPLDGVDKAVEVLKPDFVVMLLPLAVCHPSAVVRFSSTRLGLLERGFAVHSMVISLRDYGLPQERSILAVVASPFGVPLSWKFDRYTTRSEQPSTIGSLIEDLAFKNPRVGTDSNTGFVCVRPAVEGSEAEASTVSHVYNHYTGIRVASDAETISIAGTIPFSLFNDQKQWIHPVRQDRVTVRELARVQGIPDELRFLGSREEQYETVCKAIPPVVAKMIAHTIFKAIGYSRVVTVSAAEASPRRNKRARA